MNKELWQKAVAFHGHECPGLAIGFKACEVAVKKLGVGRAEDEEIVCVTENDACGVDAVQAILGCSIGKGNLIYRGTGKQAFSFFNRRTGEKIRVYLKAQRDAGMGREEWKKKLLESDVEDLFSFSIPQFALPEKARLFKSLTCEICNEGAPEHKMRLQDGKTVCLDCFKPYDRGC
jgi:formylmethanofuran dehydrogenase subunit E